MSTENSNSSRKNMEKSGNIEKVNFVGSFLVDKDTFIHFFKKIIQKLNFLQNLVLSSIQHAVNAMKSACSPKVDAHWLLHCLRCIRQMYASLIHLDLPSDALDIFGNFIFDLRCGI